jgi:dephospho-CoA kinase
MPFVVGLTGGIGSGKSTVASCFAKHGATVIDADKIARELTERESPVLVELQEVFGEDILQADGELNRALLAERAFQSAKGTQDLNSIMHQRIRSMAIERLRQLPDHEIAIYDMPLLVETQSQEMCDFVVVVNSPVSERIQRLQDSRGMALDDIQRRMSQQVTDEVRNSAADVVICNDSSLENLISQCESAWSAIRVAASDPSRRTLSR